MSDDRPYSVSKAEEVMLAELHGHGHEPRKESDGTVDWFAFECDFCSGPYCPRCQTAWCLHCWNRKSDDIETCVPVEEKKAS